MQNPLFYNQSQFQFSLFGFSKDTFSVQQFAVSLALSKHYQLSVAATSDQLLTVDDLLDKRAKLIIHSTDDDYYLHGLVSAFDYLGPSADGKKHSYQFMVESPLQSLLKRQSAQIFLNKSIPEIVKEILLATNWSPSSFVFKLQRTYSSKKFIMQLNESDFAFVERLLSEAGLIYFFLQQSTAAQLWIVDDLINLPVFSNLSLPFFTESGANKTQESVCFFEQAISSLPQQLNFSYIPWEKPENPLSITAQNHTDIPGVGISEEYGKVFENLEEAQQLVNCAMQALDWQRQVFIIKTDCRSIELGQVITLTGHYQTEYNTDYRVLGITMTGNQFREGPEETNQPTFEAIVNLIKTTHPFRVYPKEREPFHHTLPAIVEAFDPNSKEPYLDEQGCYRVRFPFDQSDCPSGQASCAVPLLQPFGGTLTSEQLPTGFHFPLRAGTQLGVGFIHKNLNQPVILGVIHNPENPSTATSDNNTQNVLRTFAGNELTLDDNKDAPLLQLATRDLKNRIVLDATPDKHQLQLISAEGNINAYAKKALHVETGDSYLQNTQGNHTVTVQNKHALLTKQGEINYQAGKNLILNANRHLQLNADQSLQLQAGKNIEMSAGNNLSQHIQNGDLQLQAARRITIQTQKNVLMHSTGSNLTIGQPSGGIVCTPEGDLYLSGPNVHFEAEEITIYGNATLNTQQSTYQYQPPQPINNQDNDNNENNKTDSDFDLFVATVYGEAAGCSETAWKAIGSVIINRLSCREYHKYKTTTEIIENTRFQAYDDQSPNFVAAKSYLDKISNRRPLKIDEIVAALKPIYYNRIVITTADHYYSPKAQHRGHQQDKHKYHDDVPNWASRGLRNGTYVQVNVLGLNDTTDDFVFLKTVK